MCDRPCSDYDRKTICAQTRRRWTPHRRFDRDRLHVEFWIVASIKTRVRSCVKRRTGSLPSVCTLYTDGRRSRTLLEVSPPTRDQVIRIRRGPPRKPVFGGSCRRPRTDDDNVHDGRFIRVDSARLYDSPNCVIRYERGKPSAIRVQQSLATLGNGGNTLYWIAFIFVFLLLLLSLSFVPTGRHGV